MCGITGIVRIDDPTRTLERMTSVLAHRGPDDEGVRTWDDDRVGLGHRRLSIIDLSPAGRNPLTNETDDVWITFNGEIYNYVELRRELIAAGHRFRSDTDTEVVVHAYEEWGDAHVDRLRGMFAYAVYDRRGDGFRLLLTRDRLGIKPLFYAHEGDRLAFASEPKSLLLVPGMVGVPDRSALFDYLTYGYVPAPRSAWTGIKKLEPGHQLVLERGRVTRRRYWAAKGTEQPLDLVAAEMVRTEIGRAVAENLTADVEVGVFLSGGIDSSSVVASVPSDVVVPTFSIGFDVAVFDETEYARLVAKTFGHLNHERVVVSSDVEAAVGMVSDMYDEPFADGSALPTSSVSALAREHVKVALSGDGGDEVFGGYARYGAWARRSRLDFLPTSMRRSLGSALTSVPALDRHTWFSDIGVDPISRFGRLIELFTPLEKRRMLGADWAEEFRDYDDYWRIRSSWKDDLDPITRLQVVDLETYLPDDILTKVDRASMAVGLEVRPPLLDHILVEKVLGLPPKTRVPGGEPKGLLKRAMRGTLPSEVLDRPKRGFSAPWNEWSDRFGPWALERLRTGAAVDHGLLRSDFDAGGRRGGAKLWALLLLDRFAERL
ncbi:MAG: asparagine synthase (glutamine-hydrolyzing) [Actinomycetota bacterium]